MFFSSNVTIGTVLRLLPCAVRAISISIPTINIPIGFPILSIANAATVVQCRSDRCIPGCDCKKADLTVCAEDYGDWGWKPPGDAVDESVYDKMPPQYEIKYNQLKPTGTRGANRKTGIGDGIGMIVDITNETMEGEVYFEIHPDLWNQQQRITADLYGGIDLGLTACDEGIVMGEELVNMTGVDDRINNFDYEVLGFDDNFSYNELFRNKTKPKADYQSGETEPMSIECHPRSTNGKIGAVLFRLKDPFYYNENSASIMNIWYPLKGSMPTGTLEFCIRLKLLEEDKATIVSFLDTKFKIEVTAPTEENNYTRFDDEFSEVNIYSNQPIGPDEDQLLELQGNTTTKAPSTNASAEDDITMLPMLVTQALLCSSPLETEDVGVHNALRTFRYGQTFRFCVGPAKGFEQKYHVVGFDTVVCDNNGRETVVVEKGILSPLVIVETDTIGFPLAKGGTVEYNGTISIDAIVSSNLAGLDFQEDANDYFECEGTLFIRDLEAEDGNVNVDNNEDEESNSDNSERRRQRRIANDKDEDDYSNSHDFNGQDTRRPLLLLKHLFRALQGEPESTPAKEATDDGDNDDDPILYDNMGRFTIRIVHVENTGNNKLTDVASDIGDWFSFSDSSSDARGNSFGNFAFGSLVLPLLLLAGLPLWTLLLSG